MSRRPGTSSCPQLARRSLHAASLRVEVDALTDEMFPDVVSKATAVSSAEGWAGVRIAAELAQLGPFEKLSG